MRIFVDENIPSMTVWALREMGHDVLDIRGTADEGITDDDISFSSFGKLHKRPTAQSWQRKSCGGIITMPPVAKIS